MSGVFLTGVVLEEEGPCVYIYIYATEFPKVELNWRVDGYREASARAEQDCVGHAEESHQPLLLHHLRVRGGAFLNRCVNWAVDQAFSFPCLSVMSLSRSRQKER